MRLAILLLFGFWLLFLGVLFGLPALLWLGVGLLGLGVIVTWGLYRRSV